jgi:hypothetical protein
MSIIKSAPEVEGVALVRKSAVPEAEAEGDGGELLCSFFHDAVHR